MWHFGVLVLFLWSAVASAQNVDYSTKIFYTPGWDQARLEHEVRQGHGKWTPFLDADRPLGVGEFEDVWRERVHYKGDCRALWCRSPKAMEVGISPRVLQYLPEASFANAWRCTNIFHKVTPYGGFLCLQRDQKWHRGPKDPACYGIGGICHKNGMKSNCERCFDARVRYFCLRQDTECRVNAFPGPIP